MSKRMTLEEISAEIGISRTTIYKVLNKKGTVSEETTQKVLDAVKEYHYIPNYNARELAKGKAYRIAYVGMHYISNNYFSILARRGMKKAFEEYRDKGLEIEIIESDFDNPKEQLEQIDIMLQKGYRNFIISPSDEYMLKDKVAQLKEDGCNIIFLSRYLDGSKYAFVGIDYYKSGMLAGEMLTKIMPQGGRIVVVTNQSPQSDTTVRGRYRGFVDWVSQYKEFEIVEVIENVNTIEQAKRTFDDLVVRYDGLEKLDAIYDITYRLDVFADKLKEYAPKRKPKLCGFDVYQEIVPHVRTSNVDFVIGQQILTQAFDAATMMFEKICYDNDYEEKNYFSKLDVVISTNVDCFVDT